MKLQKWKKKKKSSFSLPKQKDSFVHKEFSSERFFSSFLPGEKKKKKILLCKTKKPVPCPDLIIIDAVLNFFENWQTVCQCPINWQYLWGFLLELLTI